MTKFKKASAVLALSAACTVGVFGGKSLLEDVKFARAETNHAALTTDLATAKDLSGAFRDIGKLVEPSVVQIEVRKTVKTTGGPLQTPNNDQLRKFFRDHGMQAPDNLPDQGDDNGDNQPAPDDGTEEVGTGSGVIMEVDGSTAYILTNNHVAGGASEMTVTLADGRVIKGGKTIGADAKADLAVVKIKADHLIAAKWGDSDTLDVGDWVLAFGSPFGYVGSMTHGIVSALNRDTRVDGGLGILGRDGYENFIQVDAPINPGNSGGPLVNIHGEVVGINTAIASKSGSFSGIGFAIPSSEAKAIYTMLKEKGKVTRGWLGVQIEDVQRDPALAKNFGYDGDNGVIVQDVIAGTPSYGHLQADDVITSIDGKPVTNVQQLRNAIALIAPGTNVKLGVYRDKKEIDVDLTIGEQPDNLMAAGQHKDGGNAPGNTDGHADVKALGLRLSNVTDDLAQKFNLSDDQRSGALVTAVEPRSLAAEAMIQPGDLITRVGTKTVSNAKEASTELGKGDLKTGVRIRITNAEGSRTLLLQKDDENN